MPGCAPGDLSLPLVTCFEITELPEKCHLSQALPQSHTSRNYVRLPPQARPALRPRDTTGQSGCRARMHTGCQSRKDPGGAKAQGPPPPVEIRPWDKRQSCRAGRHPKVSVSHARPSSDVPLVRCLPRRGWSGGVRFIKNYGLAPTQAQCPVPPERSPPPTCILSRAWGWQEAL